jgi:hypothetical protein
VVTAVHKSLSDTLSSSSTGHSRLLAGLHYSTTPLYSVTFSDCALLLLLGTDPMENTFSCQEYVFIGPLQSSGCPSIVERVCFGMCLIRRCQAMGLCVTIYSSTCSRSTCKISCLHLMFLSGFILSCI